MVEGDAFLGAEGGEKVVFDQAESDECGSERFLSRGGELDDVASPVGGSAAPGDQSSFF